MEGEDGSIWLNSLIPMIYVLGELSLRDQYASVLKKKAHLHKELIADNIEFSKFLEKFMDDHIPSIVTYDKDETNDSISRDLLTKLELSKTNEDLNSILMNHFNNFPLDYQLKTCNKEQKFLKSCKSTDRTHLSKVASPSLLLEASECECKTPFHISCWLVSCKYNKSILTNSIATGKV
jgi:hypothetical protein